MSFSLLAILSSVCLALLSLVFVIEDRKGKRFAGRIRTMLDTSLDASIATWERHTPTLNSRFARQVFHYVSHRVLSGMLRVVRFLETYVRRALSLNRKRARTAAPKPSEHLTEIAAHKESAQLSEKEKRARKEKALRGE